MMKRPRILHAPAIVVNQQWMISRAQRRLGYVSDFMVFSADGPELLTRDCDINLHFKRNQLSFRPGKIPNTLKNLFTFFTFFIKAIFKYDVFHFHSESFFGSSSSLDLKILRLFGKKIVFQYWGCDMRLKTISTLSGNASICDDCIRACSNTRKSRDNITHLKYSDFRVYGGADIIRMIPDALFMPIAIDLEHWAPAANIPKEYALPATTNVRILQAFENPGTRGDLKGTKILKAAIEALKTEGHPIEYVFLDKVPHAVMKYYYQQADIVFDQLLVGWHGSVTVEAMAMGKPVICYLNHDAMRLLPKNNPIVNADTNTIVETLRKLVMNKELREDIGKRGRRYAEERHDAMKLAKEYVDLYGKDWR